MADIQDIEKLPEKMADWEIREIIGEGASGIVYRAERRSDAGTQVCAIKKIPVPGSREEMYLLRREYKDPKTVGKYLDGLLEEYLREITVMYELKDNENIVRIYDHEVIRQEKGPGWILYVQMEYLMDFRTYSSLHTLEENDIIRLGMDICKALTGCEKKKIIHRDIKPENIFVTETGDFKLGDFGIAREIPGGTLSYSMKGSYRFMAPEIFNGIKYNQTVDIYSLGMVLYILTNRNRSPFVNVSEEVVYYREEQEALQRRMAGEKLPQPCNASPGLAGIIIRAADADPAKRYHCSQDFYNDLAQLQRGEEAGKAKERPADSGKKTKNRPVSGKALCCSCLMVLLCCCAAVVMLILTRTENPSLHGTVTEEQRVTGLTGTTEKNTDETVNTESIVNGASKLLREAKQTAGSNDGQFRKLFLNYSEDSIKSWSAFFTAIADYEYENIVVMTEQSPYAMIGVTDYNNDPLDDNDLDSVSQTAVIVENSGTWKFDLDEEVRKMMVTEVVSKEADVYPDDLVDVLSAGGVEYSEDRNNYMYLDPKLYYAGKSICFVRHLWETTDGNIGFTIWLVNGTDKALEARNVTVRFTDKRYGMIAEETVEIGETVAPFSNVLLEYSTEVSDWRIEGQETEAGSTAEKWIYIDANIVSMNADLQEPNDI